MKIWKYNLSAVEGPEAHLMPDGAEVISVGVQNNDVVMWALVDPEAPKVVRPFVVVWTGHSDVEREKLGRFVGTATVERMGMDIVCHIFEAVVIPVSMAEAIS